MLTIEQAAQALGFTLTDNHQGISFVLNCKFYRLDKDTYILWMYDYLESYDPEFDGVEGHKAEGFVELRIEKFIGREKYINTVALSLYLDIEGFKEEFERCLDLLINPI